MVIPERIGEALNRQLVDADKLRRALSRTVITKSSSGTSVSRNVSRLELTQCWGSAHLRGIRAGFGRCSICKRRKTLSKHGSRHVEFLITMGGYCSELRVLSWSLKGHHPVAALGINGAEEGKLEPAAPAVTIRFPSLSSLFSITWIVIIGGFSLRT